VRSAKKLIVPRYMQDFRCIAEACEDDCCHDLPVPVDGHTREILRRALKDSKADLALFKKAVPEANPSLMLLKDDGTCMMQEETLLCCIHRRFGQGALPPTCRRFPRRVYPGTHHIELSAALSCPEIARLCLLNPESMGVVDVDAELYPDAVDVQAPLEGPLDHYYHHIEQIRDVALGFLPPSSSQIPLATRLFLTGAFAQRVSVFLQNGLKAPPNLRELIAAVEIPASHGKEFESTDIDVDPAMSIIRGIVTSPIRQTPTRFAQLLGEVAEHYGGALEEGAPVLTRSYMESQSAVQAVFSKPLGQYFTNYASNYWFGARFAVGDSMVDHCRDLFVRMAVLNFVLVGNPKIAALASRVSKGEVKGDDARASLDRIAVDVFYSFSRALDHQPKLLAMVHQFMIQNGIGGLPGLALMLKFWAGGN